MNWPSRPRGGIRPVPSPFRFSLAALVAALLAPAFPPVPAARAEALLARVVSVHDGDTLTVLHERRQIRVRLKDIDAPELGQPFGRSARQSLAEVCFGKLAALDVSGTDRYRRAIARVTCDGTEASREQVRRGYAWTYVRYARRDSGLHAIEREARAARRGLWSAPDPVAPWDWRRNGRLARGRTVPPAER